MEAGQGEHNTTEKRRRTPSLALARKRMPSMGTTTAANIEKWWRMSLPVLVRT
jgi:hypothetical protein